MTGRIFRCDEVLIAAKDLLSHSSVEIDKNLTEVTYLHLLFDEHQIINANGIAAESLYLGEEGVKAMTSAARKELTALFPQFADDPSLVSGDLCRVAQSGKTAKKLAFRAEKNGKGLVAHL